MIDCKRILVCLFCSLSLFAAGSDGVHARQFRLLNSIDTPRAAEQLPEGAITVAAVAPVSRAEAEAMMAKVVKEWNTSRMPEILGEEFYDGERLLDGMRTIVPRDASLRLQSVQGVQTLQQYIVPGQGGGRGELVSIVSVTARIQGEFNAPTGFVRRDTTNEFILKVTQAAPP